MNKGALVVLAYLLSGAFNYSVACTKVGSSTYESPLRVVEFANRITLAQLQKAEATADSIRFEFRTLERIFGDQKDTFILEFLGRVPGFTGPLGDHSTYEFWTHSYGGTSDSYGCEVRPGFQVLQEYLIIEHPEDFGTPAIAYELIEFDNDRWLQFVRRAVAGEAANTPVFTTKEFFAQFSSIQVFDCSDRLAESPEPLQSVVGVFQSSQMTSISGYGEICKDGTEDFLLLHAHEGRPTLVAPIDGGIIQLEGFARGLEIIPQNQIGISTLISILDSKSQP